MLGRELRTHLLRKMVGSRSIFGPQAVDPLGWMLLVLRYRMSAILWLALILRLGKTSTLYSSRMRWDRGCSIGLEGAPFDRLLISFEGSRRGRWLSIW